MNINPEATPVAFPTPGFSHTPQELYQRVQDIAWTEALVVFSILAGFVGFSLLIGALFKRG